MIMLDKADEESPMIRCRIPNCVCRIPNCVDCNELVNEFTHHHFIRTSTEIDDPVNHPKHYTSHPSGIECIEITRYYNFNIGNAMKYLWRHGLKGSTVEDLKKAVWYIQDEIKKMESDIE